MGVGITPEHEALRRSVRGWLERHVPPEVVRHALDSAVDERPGWWTPLVEQGWLGLVVSEDRGGEGFGWPELVVVLEELGRACAPGPLVPHLQATAILQRAGGALADELLPRMVEGRAIATVAMTSLLEGAPASSGGGLVASGVAEPVFAAGASDVMLVSVKVTGDEGWGRIAVVDLATDGCRVEAVPSLDPTRPVSRVHLDEVHVGEERMLAADHTWLGEWASGFVYAAEAVGVADWCVETAASYAKVREQFGRPIGQFQAVKHRCADMLVRTELARAAVWDQARPGSSQNEDSLTAAVAAGLALDGAFECAKDCVQVLGGIGFTWEHDAHVYLRRATAIRAGLCGPEPWYQQAAELVAGGVRRSLDVDLPAEAEQLRPAVAAVADELKAIGDRAARRERMAAEGWIAPHWPSPWGRDATALEQVVIDEEFARAQVRRPHLQVGAWVLPTIIAHGTVEQQERWIPPTMGGEITWCQLFSEPGAGSDLASLATKAVRTDGGWLLSGQKVWTTMAHTSHWGICLARTNPEAPKHQGITCFLIDMSSEGIDIRPLKELTGAEMFNEVFLSDVFVPDDCVIGEVDDGWRVGRTTLANERVSMGSGASFGLGLESLLGLAGDRLGHDAHLRHTIGRLVAHEQALAVLGVRTALRALSGAEPGAESSVRKLAGVEHDQLLQEVGMTLLDASAAMVDGDGATWTHGFLANRCLTIAGGTSEVQRNVIAERLLGLPRDP